MLRYRNNNSLFSLLVDSTGDQSCAHGNRSEQARGSLPRHHGCHSGLAAWSDDRSISLCRTAFALNVLVYSRYPFNFQCKDIQRWSQLSLQILQDMMAGWNTDGDSQVRIQQVNFGKWLSHGQHTKFLTDADITSVSWNLSCMNFHTLCFFLLTGCNCCRVPELSTLGR